MNETATTTDKRLLRGEESRRLILQSAVDCIAMQGLGQLTLDRVADRVGMSRGLIVFHFKSKQKLIEEVLCYLGQQYSSGWDAIIRRPGEDDAAKLIRLIEYDVQFACDNPSYISAWHAFWGDSRGRQLFYELVVPRDEGYAADIETLLARISRDGGYEPAELAPVTRGLVMMMFGVWTQLHLNPSPDDFSVSADAIYLYLRKVFPRTDFPGFRRD